MGYLAYAIGTIDKPPIDISSHVSVLQWGKTSALRVNSNEGKAIMKDFFQTHAIHLIYGPKGNDVGMTKLQQQVQPASNFEVPIVGAIFYFSVSGTEEISEF